MQPETSANIKYILSRRCALHGIPISGIFELTPRCNLNCKMCYVRLTPAEMEPLGRELTANEWLELAQQAKDAGMVFLLLTGGEPTLREDFPYIYEQLAQMGFSLSVNTNATMLTPAIREVWHRFPPAQVNVTVYGTCREDYQDLCSNPSAYDAMVDNVQWLLSEGILTHLNATMVPENQEKWLEIEEFAKARGLALRMTTYCFPPVRRNECASCNQFHRLPPEEAAQLMINDLHFREGDATVKYHAQNLSAPPHAECELGIGETIQCLAGRSQFWLAWNGNMTPCGMLPEPVSYPAEQGFAPAWNDLHRQTTSIRLCPDCVDCEIRSTCLNCAAVIYSESQTFTQKPEYMCQMNKAFRKKIQELADRL